METSDGAVEETHSTHTEKDVDKEVESVRVVVVRVCGDGEAHAVSVLWRGGVVSSTELQDAVREAFLVAHKDAVWVMDTRGDVLLGEEDTGPLLSLGDRRTLFLALSPEERDAVVARQQQPAALLSMHMNVTPHVNILIQAGEEYDFYTSVDEIVDNSIQSTLGSSPRLISIDRIAYRKEKVRGKLFVLAISDNGKGMTLSELHAWATMGKTSIAMDKEAWDCRDNSAAGGGRTATRAASRAHKERTRDEKYTTSKFSRYGVGSKKAIFNLGDIVTVYSRAPGQPICCGRFSRDELEKEQQWKAKFSVFDPTVSSFEQLQAEMDAIPEEMELLQSRCSSADYQKSFTILMIRPLRELYSREYSGTKTRNHLAHTFHYYLWGEKGNQGTPVEGSGACPEVASSVPASHEKSSRLSIAMAVDEDEEDEDFSGGACVLGPSSSTTSGDEDLLQIIVDGVSAKNPNSLDLESQYLQLGVNPMHFEIPLSVRTNSRSSKAVLHQRTTVMGCLYYFPYRNGQETLPIPVQCGDAVYDALVESSTESGSTSESGSNPAGALSEESPSTPPPLASPPPSGTQSGMFSQAPFLSQKPGRKKIDWDEEYRLEDRGPGLEIFWLGRLLPGEKTRSLQFMRRTNSGHDALPPQCFNRVKGMLFLDSSFEVSQNKQYLLNYTPLAKELMEWNDPKMAARFRSWLRENHLKYDEEVVFDNRYLITPPIGVPASENHQYFSQVKAGREIRRVGDYVVLKTRPKIWGQIVYLLRDLDAEPHLCFCKVEEFFPESSPGSVHTMGKISRLVSREEWARKVRASTSADPAEIRLHPSLDDGSPFPDRVQAGSRLKQICCALYSKDNILVANPRGDVRLRASFEGDESSHDVCATAPLREGVFCFSLEDLALDIAGTYTFQMSFSGEGVSPVNATLQVHPGSAHRASVQWNATTLATIRKVCTSVPVLEEEVFPSGFGAWKRSVVQGNTDVQGQESEDQRESQNEDADIFWISLGDELPPLLVSLADAYGNGVNILPEEATSLADSLSFQVLQCSEETCGLGEGVPTCAQLVDFSSFEWSLEPSGDGGCAENVLHIQGIRIKEMPLGGSKALRCALRACFSHEDGTVERHGESVGLLAITTGVPACLQFTREPTIHSLRKFHVSLMISDSSGNALCPSLLRRAMAMRSSSPELQKWALSRKFHLRCLLQGDMVSGRSGFVAVDIDDGGHAEFVNNLHLKKGWQKFPELAFLFEVEGFPECNVPWAVPVEVLQGKNYSLQLSLLPPNPEDDSCAESSVFSWLLCENSPENPCTLKVAASCTVTRLQARLVDRSGQLMSCSDGALHVSWDDGEIRQDEDENGVFLLPALESADRPSRSKCWVKLEDEEFGALVTNFVLQTIPGPPAAWHMLSRIPSEIPCGSDVPISFTVVDACGNILQLVGDAEQYSDLALLKPELEVLTLESGSSCSSTVSEASWIQESFQQCVRVSAESGCLIQLLLRDQAGILSEPWKSEELTIVHGEPVSVRINGEESIREVIPSMGVLRGLVADMLDECGNRVELAGKPLEIIAPDETDFNLDLLTSEEDICTGSDGICRVPPILLFGKPGTYLLSFRFADEDCVEATLEVELLESTLPETLVLLHPSELPKVSAGGKLPNLQVGLENAKKERVAVRQAPKITVCTATGTETTMFASPTVEDGGDSWDSFTFDMSGMIFSEAGECSLLLEADFSELLEPELRADAPALSSSLEFRVSGGAPVRLEASCTELRSVCCSATAEADDRVLDTDITIRLLDAYDNISEDVHDVQVLLSVKKLTEDGESIAEDMNLEVTGECVIHGGVCVLQSVAIPEDCSVDGDFLLVISADPSRLPNLPSIQLTFSVVDDSDLQVRQNDLVQRIRTVEEEILSTSKSLQVQEAEFLRHQQDIEQMNAECESVLQELKSSRAFAKCRPKDWEDLGRLVLALEKKIQSLVDGSDRRPESLAWDASLQEVVQIRTAEGSNSGIIGLVGECGFVDREELDACLSQLLGSNMQLVLLKDSSTYERLRAHLRGASSQVSFLPLDNVHRPPTLQRSEDGKSFLLRYPLSEKNATEVPGMQGFSCNLVELRESQEDLRIALLSLLGESIVFDCRENALAYRKKVLEAGKRCPLLVSLDGERIEATGIMYAGRSRQATTSRFGQLPITETKLYKHSVARKDRLLYLKQLREKREALMSKVNEQSEKREEEESMWMDKLRNLEMQKAALQEELQEVKSRMKGSTSGRVAPRGRRVGRTSALARKRRAEAEEVDVDSVQDLTDLEDSEPDMGGEAAAVDDLPSPVRARTKRTGAKKRSGSKSKKRSLLDSHQDTNVQGEVAGESQGENPVHVEADGHVDDATDDLEPVRKRAKNSGKKVRGKKSAAPRRLVK